MSEQNTTSCGSIKKDNYCPHGFCRGKFNCDNFFPINGSGLCVFSPIVSATTKIKIYIEHMEKCMAAGMYGQARYWEKKIQRIEADEPTGDSCALVFDSHYGVDG